jgi:hypothetical protein
VPRAGSACHAICVLSRSIDVEVVVVPRAVLLALFWRQTSGWCLMNIPPTDSEILICKLCAVTTHLHRCPSPSCRQPHARLYPPTSRMLLLITRAQKEAMIYFASLVHKRHSQLACAPYELVGVLLFLQRIVVL